MGDEISGELNIIANPKKAGLMEVMSIEKDRFSLYLKEFMMIIMNKLFFAMIGNLD